MESLRMKKEQMGSLKVKFELRYFKVHMAEHKIPLNMLR